MSSADAFDFSLLTIAFKLAAFAVVGSANSSAASNFATSAETFEVLAFDEVAFFFFPSGASAFAVATASSANWICFASSPFASRCISFTRATEIHLPQPSFG